MSGYGPLYAACVLRPFAEQLIEALGEVSGRRILVIPGDAGMLSAELKRRGAVVAGLGETDDAAALGTLGMEMWPASTLTRMHNAAAHGVVAAVHFTQTSAHEAIALSALSSVNAAAPDPTLVRLNPSAIAGYTVTTVRDIARFDSPRQFYAALIGERGGDAGLDALQRQRILAHLTEALRPVTAFDDTIRLPVEALLLVRAGSA